MSKHPKIFISYSHDDEAHKKWVKTLATQLKSSGVDVILDQWSIGPGDNLTDFMENSIDEAERILVICSENYIMKAKKSEGNVGYEKRLISNRILENANKNLVIPIIRNNSTSKKMPGFLGSLIYLDFCDDDCFENNFQKLMFDINNQKVKLDSQELHKPFKQTDSNINTSVLKTFNQIISNNESFGLKPLKQKVSNTDPWGVKPLKQKVSNTDPWSVKPLKQKISNTDPWGIKPLKKKVSNTDLWGIKSLKQKVSNTDPWGIKPLTQKVSNIESFRSKINKPTFSNPDSLSSKKHEQTVSNDESLIFKLLKPTVTNHGSIASFNNVQYISPHLNGTVTFDFSNNNGCYILGNREKLFETRWSRASSKSINVWNDENSIKSVAIAINIFEISDIIDANVFNASWKLRNPHLNEIVIWQNTQGYYLATKIINIKSRGHGQNIDEVTFTYVIAPNKSSSFKST